MKKIFTFFIILGALFLFATPSFAKSVAYGGPMPKYHTTSSTYEYVQSRSILHNTPSLQSSRTYRNRNLVSYGYNNYPQRQVNNYPQRQTYSYYRNNKHISSMPPASGMYKVRYENGRYVQYDPYNNNQPRH